MDIDLIFGTVAGLIAIASYMIWGKKIGADKVKNILKAIYDLVKKP